MQDIGQRQNQEDSFYPPFVNPQHFDKTDRAEAYIEGTPRTEDSLFILCDGMGGHDLGEVASGTVCDAMSRHIIDAERAGRVFDSDLLNEAIKVALRALDAKENPDKERRMGTTMTLLKVQDNGATIAHIGDSRVYHFRPQWGRAEAHCLFVTEDHSYGNMFKNGHNTKSSNQLVRVMMAYGNDNFAKADIYHTDDIMPGDVFFMCSDGMLEELCDDDLGAMMTNNNYTDEQRIQVLMTFCEGNRDNHTAWFIRVESRDEETYQLPDEDAVEESQWKQLLDGLASWFGM